MIAAGAGITLFLQIKKLTNRPRPCTYEPHCWAVLLPPDQFSFPSGHTITAFSVAVSLSLFYPSLAAGIAVLRDQRRRFPCRARHAFPQRRAGGRGDRDRLGLHRALAVGLNVYSTGESFPNSARRTILIGGYPCAMNASWKPCSVYDAPFIFL